MTEDKTRIDPVTKAILGTIWGVAFLFVALFLLQYFDTQEGPITPAASPIVKKELKPEFFGSISLDQDKMVRHM